MSPAKTKQGLHLELKDLSIRFSLEAGLFARYGRFVYAVNGVSLQLRRGETYGLVGESGCGKTTLARLAVKMYKADTGEILFHQKKGELLNLDHLSKKELLQYRSRVKYVFQDPARSLNPRMNIYSILTSGYRQSSYWPGDSAAREEAGEMMKTVGLSAEDLDRRPADFSGGQRQRISIARALIMRPELLICDEVVSALDVSIQSQILNLLLELKEKFNLTMLFIAHDLTVTSYFCDRIGVMYRGKIVEEASAEELTESRLHPYTRLLYNSIPSRMSPTLELKAFEPFDSTKALEGCPFYHRCPDRQEVCTDFPELVEIKPDHWAACFFAGDPKSL
ncbi:ABC transporter ATP-binding protein [Oceanispirochaeta sp.]|jgi:oligopeptide/dipeptide ABC transporter ATP-binding protein|uniref:oligopeptide/dipeptide ABC transporter ATP-binding protein n=1 Tax=Oceanispirochaeta sp. TaxID=2035350 RepID=UPI0026371F56|nr:ABC transporter ATP-binding protein [Oceanispirochaeta sp.]MDA3957416.1 ABC transporter ATP-binding protein [Oceanispirochaeta sp.]